MRGSLARLWRALLLAAALPLALPGVVHAHDVAAQQRIHAFARAEGDRLQLLLRIPLELLLNVDLPKRGNGYIDLEHVDEAFPRALKAAAKDIELFEDGRLLAPVAGEARIALPSDRAFESFERAWAAVRGERLPPGTDVFWNQGWFDAVLEYPLRAGASGLEIDFHVAPGLRERLKLDLRYVTPGGDVRAFELATGSGRVPLDPRWFTAALTFVQSGVQHIAGGFDHLLFLLCLVAPFRRLGWPLVGVVTSFTVAHSVTLLAAAFGFVPEAQWFPPLVEAAIAASILYMAVENLLRPNLHRRWLLAGAFGLVHGFGFSFGLAQELQFAGSHLVLSLLAFNVGIELGQLSVLALAWPLLAWVVRAARDERIVIVLLSAFVGHEAWHWIVERLAKLRQVDGPWLDPAFWPRAAMTAFIVLALVLAVRALRQRPSAPLARGSVEPP